jgi:hypothetical protein
MKNLKLLIPIAFLIAVLLGGCCKSKNSTPASQIVSFDLPYTDTSYLPVISPVPFPEDFTADNLFSYAFATYSDSLFKQNGSSANKIVSVKCDALSMSQYDASKYLDFIKDIKMYVANKDGSNKVLIGSKLNVPLSTNAIQLDLTGAELKSYMIADTFKLIVGGTIRKNTVIPPNSFLRYLAKFHCDSNP